MSMRSTWGEPSGSLLTLLKNIHIIYWLNKTELGKESKIEHQQQLKTASAGNWQRNSLAFNPTWDFNVGKFSFRKSCWNNKSCMLFLQHEGHEKVLLLQIIFFFKYTGVSGNTGNVSFVSWDFAAGHLIFSSPKLRGISFFQGESTFWRRHS